MKSALFLLLALSAQAAPIDGVVLNGTTGKPQPSATVTLYKVGQNGPESLESVKTDAEGHFTLTQDTPGPRLLQAAFDGVTYNHMLPPGQPSTNVQIEVYKSIAQPGAALVDQHMLLLEPTSDNHLAVSEGYIWENKGNTTFNDPAKGTLQFYLPAAAQNLIVNFLAPQGMPIRRAPDKTSIPDVYKLDVPIKPGQSQIQISYSMPFTSPGEFQSKVYYKGGPTRVIVPKGVTVTGDALTSMGTGPMEANIFSTDATNIKVNVSGTGMLKQEAAADDQGGGGGGSQIAQIMPRLYQSGDPNGGFPAAFNSVKWIVLAAMTILALGFTLLYRASPIQPEIATAKAKSDRRRG